MTSPGQRLSYGLVGSGDPEKVAALEELPIDSIWTGGHVASRNPSPEVLMSLAGVLNREVEQVAAPKYTYGPALVA